MTPPPLARSLTDQERSQLRTSLRSREAFTLRLYQLVLGGGGGGQWPSEAAATFANRRGRLVIRSRPGRSIWRRKSVSRKVSLHIWSATKRFAAPSSASKSIRVNGKRFLKAPFR